MLFYNDRIAKCARAITVKRTISNVARFNTEILNIKHFVRVKL